MKSRWAMFTIGAWLFGSLMVAIVAAENFYTVDRLLAGSTSSTFQSMVERLGQPQARQFLRYLSSELNRLYFQLWNVAQLALGGVLLWLLARDASVARARWGVMAMLAAVAAMTGMTPAITSIGRSLDFAPSIPPPLQFQRFWILHGAYSVLAILQLAIGSVVAVSIGRSRAMHQADRAAA
jgi:hypothetical protein